MATTALPAGGIALHGAPDFDMGSKEAKPSPMQAMQLDMTQDMVDELLESVRSGKPPQIFFGRTPQLKYGDRIHVLQTSSESYRHELYQASGAGSGDDDDDGLEFAGLIHHSLAVQQAEDATAGVDTALEQLKSSMAALSEMKEANKTIVGDATPMRTPGHRRFPSKGFNAQHLAPSASGSPLLGVPASPMRKPPTSQPAGSHDAVLRALRVPLIHLLAVRPIPESRLAARCRTSLANVRDLLPKIAKRSPDDADWKLTDKSFKELNPYKFPYETDETREDAINSAIKAFDRLRLAKDDKLWQILLPVDERGQGKCLSRLNVKAPEQKAATPLHKMPKLIDKKPAAAKKTDDKDQEKEAKKAREVKEVKEQPKQRRAVKEKAPAVVKEAAAKPSNAAPSTLSKPTAPQSRATPSMEATKIRTKKAAPPTDSAPRMKPKMASRDVPQKDRLSRPSKPAMPVNTKPKNPSPLSASPPVNASDFGDNHPVHKKLSAAPSPAKVSSGNSDRSLKRKANDIDSDIHNHSLSVKQARVGRPIPGHTPTSTNSRVNGNTPASGNSLKRKSDDSSASNTPTNKIRKVSNIDIGLASRYPRHNNQLSPADSSSSATSPSVPNLSFRQTVELSQRFQKYYKKYEELYWQLADADAAPTESQRSDLMKMHKKLEEMKREIKAGAGVGR